MAINNRIWERRYPEYGLLMDLAEQWQQKAEELRQIAADDQSRAKEFEDGHVKLMVDAGVLHSAIEASVKELIGKMTTGRPPDKELAFHLQFLSSVQGMFLDYATYASERGYQNDGWVLVTTLVRDISTMIEELVFAWHWSDPEKSAEARKFIESGGKGIPIQAIINEFSD